MEAQAQGWTGIQGQALDQNQVQNWCLCRCRYQTQYRDQKVRVVKSGCLAGFVKPLLERVVELEIIQIGVDFEIESQNEIVTVSETETVVTETEVGA